MALAAAAGCSTTSESGDMEASPPSRIALRRLLGPLLLEEEAPALVEATADVGDNADRSSVLLLAKMSLLALTESAGDSAEEVGVVVIGADGVDASAATSDARRGDRRSTRSATSSKSILSSPVVDAEVNNELEAAVDLLPLNEPLREGRPDPRLPDRLGRLPSVDNEDPVLGDSFLSVTGDVEGEEAVAPPVDVLGEEEEEEEDFFVSFTT